MKYKNISESVLKFRAHNSKGIKQVFTLKPGEEIESDRVCNLGGLEEFKEEKKVKKGDQ